MRPDILLQLVYDLYLKVIELKEENRQLKEQLENGSK